jgi:uncharacterized membrane protein
MPANKAIPSRFSLISNFFVRVSPFEYPAWPMQHPSADRATIVTQFHQALTLLLAAALALELFAFFAPLNLDGWPEIILILLAAASTLSALARRLPLQNVLLAASGIALIGGGAHALGAKTGIPFGPLIFGGMGDLLLFKTLPWPVPLLWIIVVLNSRGVAQLILRPWRKTKTYGFWLIGNTGALAMLFDFALEPFASRVKHYWLWMPGNPALKFIPAWFGAPLVNFFNWGLVTALILAFVTPALIRKQPGQKKGPNFHPLCLWLAAILIFGTDCASHGLWPAVTADAAIGIVTGVFAVRGAKW